jgi:hypothetical protein
VKRFFDKNDYTTGSGHMPRKGQKLLGDDKYTTVVSLSRAQELALREYARRHTWTLSQAMREALKVATEIDAREHA